MNRPFWNQNGTIPAASARFQTKYLLHTNYVDGQPIQFSEYLHRAHAKLIEATSKLVANDLQRISRNKLCFTDPRPISRKGSKRLTGS